MDNNAAFLQAIVANPGDEDLRLVYMDWLEERGDPRAEFLRVRAELDRLLDALGTSWPGRCEVALESWRVRFPISKSGWPRWTGVGRFPIPSST